VTSKPGLFGALMTIDSRLWTAFACGVVGIGLVLGGPFAARPRVFVGLLLAALCGWAFAGLVRRFEPTELAVGSLIFWGVTVAALHPVDLLRAKETLVSWFVAWLLWIGARRTPSCGRLPALTVMWSTGMILAVIAVFEAIIVDVSRVGGVFENPNVLAAMLLPLMPLLWRKNGSSGVRAVLCGIVAAAILAGGLVATGSRAAVLSILVAAILMMPKGRPRLVAAIGGGLAAAILLAWRMLTVVDPLAWHRLTIWRGVIELWRDHLFAGIGPGALPLTSGVVRISHVGELAVHQRVIGYAESTLLAIPVQLGLVGLTLAGLVIWLWVRSEAGRGLFRSSSARGALGAIAVFAVFHDVTTVEPVLWWWALVIGLLESRHLDEVSSAASTLPARWFAAAATIGLVVWGLVSPAAAYTSWEGSDRSTAAVEKALRLEPWAARPAVERTIDLLKSPTWRWQDAAEGLTWARHAERVRPGSGQTWAIGSRCRRRSMRELGGWEPDLEAARHNIHRACELEPRLPWYWYEWAELEAEWSGPGAALAHARRSVDLEPNFVRGWMLISELELQSGRTARASAALVSAKAASARGRGRHLTDYERSLMVEPGGRLQRLEMALQ